MNDRQRDYFRAKLLAWKDEILRESKITLQTLQEENVNHPDLADRASSETDRAIELRARDRQRKLISKIDAALQRIEDNTYGYCEETGEPISLKRLEARPIATLSVEAQERHEKREKVYRDEVGVARLLFAPRGRCSTSLSRRKPYSFDQFSAFPERRRQPIGGVGQFILDPAAAFRKSRPQHQPVIFEFAQLHRQHVLRDAGKRPAQGTEPRRAVHQREKKFVSICR